MAEIRGIPREDILRDVASAALPGETRSRFLSSGQDKWMELDTAKRMSLFLPLLESPYTLTVRFENLVGARGGGSDAVQRNEIEKIAAHLGMRLTPDDIDCVIEKAFNPKSPTFRKGLIGDWKSHFTPEHKDAFKRVAGQLLIDLGYEKDFEW